MKGQLGVHNICSKEDSEALWRHRHIDGTMQQEPDTSRIIISKCWLESPQCAFGDLETRRSASGMDNEDHILQSGVL